MAVTLLRPDGESVRHKLMRLIIAHWHRENPREAAEIARFLKEQTSHQVKASGAARERGETYFKVSLPQDLMLRFRLIFRKCLPDEPPFAHDDEDLRFLVREFPEWVGGKNISRHSTRKDHRPKTQLWSSHESRNRAGASASPQRDSLCPEGNSR